MRIRPRHVIYAFIILVVVLSFALASLYTTSTEYGECVGLNQTKVDSLVYEPNINNIIVAVVGIETLVIPVYIVLTSLECPVGVK